MSSDIDNLAEAEDDVYCSRLYRTYLNDPDPEKNEVMSEEEVCKLLDVTL